VRFTYSIIENKYKRRMKMRTVKLVIPLILEFEALEEFEMESTDIPDIKADILEDTHFELKKAVLNKIKENQSLVSRCKNFGVFIGENIEVTVE